MADRQSGELREARAKVKELEEHNAGLQVRGRA